VIEVLESQRGRPTAAVIVLTDGVTTSGKSLSAAAQVARRKTIPLFLVGLGSDRPVRDLRVGDLSSTKRCSSATWSTSISN
jgi:hypothetical protein